MTLLWCMAAAALAPTAGWLPGALALGAAVWLGAFTPGASLASCAAVIVFAAAVPCAARLAGGILDNFALAGVKGSQFSTAGAALGFALLLQRPEALDHFLAAVQFSRAAHPQVLMVWFGTVISTVIFCGGVIAIFAIALHLLVEVPFVWFSGAARARAACAWEAVRPLTVLAAVSLFFSIIMGSLAAAFETSVPEKPVMSEKQ